MCSRTARSRSRKLLFDLAKVGQESARRRGELLEVVPLNLCHSMSLDTSISNALDLGIQRRRGASVAAKATRSGSELRAFRYPMKKIEDDREPRSSQRSRCSRNWQPRDRFLGGRRDVEPRILVSGT